MVWFRRDLRLDDNPAWAAATAAHDQVVALFVLEPDLLAAGSELRRSHLFAHLRALDERVRALGGALAVRPGPAMDAVPTVVTETNASAIYLNTDVTPYSLSRDAATRRAVDVPIHAFHGSTVHEPGAVLTKKGALSRVFTPFYRTWSATDPTPWPEPGSGKPIELAGVGIPTPSTTIELAPGEHGAWSRLTSWLAMVDDYPDTRDVPAVSGTSALSIDLKFGTLAARTVLDTVGADTPGRTAFVRQLAWRDWYTHLLAKRTTTTRSRGVATTTGSFAGAKAGPASQLSTPACASSPPVAGCTIGYG